MRVRSKNGASFFALFLQVVYYSSLVLTWV